MKNKDVITVYCSSISTYVKLYSRDQRLEFHTRALNSKLLSKLAKTYCFGKLSQTAAAQRLVTWMMMIVGVHLNCVYVTPEGIGDLFSYSSERKQQPLKAVMYLDTSILTLPWWFLGEKPVSLPSPAKGLTLTANPK